jgi:carbamoyltransferase
MCLLHGDEIVVAIQEERLTGTKRARIRRWNESLAFRYCLEVAGIRWEQLDAIVGCCFAGEMIEGGHVADGRWKGRISWIPHHLGHALAAYATSGLEEAAVLIIDGAGGLEKYEPPSERALAKYARAPGLGEYSEIMSIYRVNAECVEPLEKHYGTWLVDGPEGDQFVAMPRFASLGGMYSAATVQIFGDPMDPGKVMGLAAYGRPEIPCEEFFQIAADGHYEFSDAVRARFPFAARWPNHRTAYETLAASVQSALEVGVFSMARRTASISGCDALAYAGGVALNSVANEKLLRSKMFRELFVMPAAEDSGPAIGAAYHGLRELGYRAPLRVTRRDSLGKRYSSAEIERAIGSTPSVELVHAERDVLDSAVELLVNGKIVGWFQQGCELGPRALGQRSILADPRRQDVKEILNDRVKHREPFRPFAPAILEEEVSRWFDLLEPDRVTPYMLRAPAFLPDAAKLVPGAVHHDGTGRLQTVGADADPMYRELLRRFYARTGVPILINTSFNVMGEPIVETPEDALFCLLYTELDYCILERSLVRRVAGFRSVLDLVPRLLAEEVTFTIRPTDGRMTTDLDSVGGQMEVTCTRPWGKSRVSLPVAWLAMIELIDGRRSGTEIMETLRGKLVPNVLPTDIARAFRMLRRSGVVEFMGPRADVRLAAG